MTSHKIIIMEWVLNDNITSAETLVQMMFNSMPKPLKIIFFQKKITAGREINLHRPYRLISTTS